MSSQITHQLRIRVGTQKGADSRNHHEYLTIGQEVEENFGKGNTRTLLKIHAALLSPTLYAQVKPLLGGSAYVYVERDRLERRAPDRGTPPPPTTPEPETEEPWIDPDNP